MYVYTSVASVYMGVYMHLCLCKHTCVCVCMCVYACTYITVWNGREGEGIFWWGMGGDPKNTKQTELLTRGGQRPAEKPP